MPGTGLSPATPDLFTQDVHRLLPEMKIIRLHNAMTEYKDVGNMFLNHLEEYAPLDTLSKWYSSVETNL